MATAVRHETLFGTLLHVGDLDVGNTSVYRLAGYELGPDHGHLFLGVNPPSYRVDLVAEYTPDHFMGRHDLQIVEEIAYTADSLEMPLGDTNILATFSVRYSEPRALYEMFYATQELAYASAKLWDSIAVALISASRQRPLPDRHSKRLQAGKSDPRDGATK